MGATAAVAAAMVLEDEGVSDSTAGVLRELRASGMFSDLPELAAASGAVDSLAIAACAGEAASGAVPTVSPRSVGKVSDTSPRETPQKDDACPQDGSEDRQSASQLSEL